jgi:hypothetical protein
MAIFSSILLALTLGVTIGLNFKRIVGAKKQNYFVPDSKNQISEYQLHDIQSLIPYFDTLEIRFLKRILSHDDKLLSVNEANEILRIERLSKENQRQRRHLFLKDLNVKLKMIYKIPECIERKSTELDRRSKYYSLHEQISKESIEEMLIEENSK